jgi:hypothetical protein
MANVLNLVDGVPREGVNPAITALTGDVTASGPGSAVASLVATSNATLTTLSALTTATSLVSIGTVTTGTWNATTIAIAHGGTGQTTAIAAFDALSPMTTAGDLIYENATPTAARLAIGTAGQVLTVVSGLPAWATASSGGVTTVGTIDGGTDNANALFISGTTIYAQTASATNVGIVNTTTQSFAGNKTFTGTVSSPGAGTTSEHFGAGSTAAGANSTAFGNGATATAADSTAIGFGASVGSSSTSSIAIGYDSSITNSNLGAVVIGSSASVSDNYGIAIGSNSTAIGTGDVSIGHTATGSGPSLGYGTAIGYNASTTGGQYAVALGVNSLSAYQSSISIGPNAATTAANQLVIGASTSGTSFISAVYIGNGVTAIAPQAFTLNGTGGSGSNIAGAAVNIAGGQSTGTGLGGVINFKTSPAGSSSSTLNALVTVMSLSSTGAVSFSGSAGTSGQILTSNGTTSAPTWTTAGATPTLTTLGIFSGKTAISSGAVSQAVTLSTAFGSTAYSITANMLNVTDTNPQYQPITITAQATTGFTASWDDPTLTANYVLSWQAIAAN